MPKLEWDAVGSRFYETGVRNVALYVMNEDGSYADGVAWSGVTAITESPSGAEKTPLYADDIKYLNLLAAEDFGATIECYTYPDEFKACNGEVSIAAGITVGQQDRRIFGLAYKTVLGNDTLSNGYGYKIHIIYGCQASPSERAYSTINESPEAITFSYEMSTTPVNVTGPDGTALKPTAHLEIDSKKIESSKLAILEKKLFGGEQTTEKPTLLLPDDLLDLIA